MDYWQKFEQDQIYHIYNRGIDNMTIFKEERNYHFFLKNYKRLIAPFFDTVAYCLMPNHFHFLIRVKTVDATVKDAIKLQNTRASPRYLEGEINFNDFLESQFKRLFSSYALAFNKQEGRTGSLFQKRFKRVTIYSTPRCLHLITYIHHNPIHHKYRNDFGRWTFCSFQAYSSSKTTLIDKERGLKWFDNDQKLALNAFHLYHQTFKKDQNFANLYLE